MILKNTFILFVGTLLFGCNSLEVAPEQLSFIKYYGGVSSQIPADIIQEPDGFYILGSSNSFSPAKIKGAHDFYLVKTDTKGNEVFSKLYGDKNANNIAEKLIKDDDNYIILGNSIKTDLSTLIVKSVPVIIKIDKEGNSLFEKNYDLDNAEVKSIVRMDDGGFAMVGTIKAEDPSYFVLRTDNQGEIIWINKGGVIGFDDGFEIKKLNNGSVMIFNNTIAKEQLQDGVNIQAIIINNNGLATSSAIYGGNDDDYAFGVFQKNTNYYVVGSTKTNFEGDEILEQTDVLVFKFDFDGQFSIVDTYQQYGGTEDHVGIDIAEDTNGNFIVLGTRKTADIPFNDDLYLLKLNNDLRAEKDWLFNERTYGASGDDFASKIITNPDGYYVFGSISFSSEVRDNTLLSLLKTNLGGKLTF